MHSLNVSTAGILFRTNMKFTSLLTLLLIAGCAQENREPAPSINHPANSGAFRAPLPATQPIAGAEATPAMYTCPHHPRVMQSEPGKCPICEMELVPTNSRQTSPVREAPREQSK